MQDDDFNASILRTEQTSVFQECAADCSERRQLLMIILMWPVAVAIDDNASH